MPLRDLVGNEAARQALLRALEHRRLPHALLLHGPPGIGKRALATALAQALLCPQVTASDACGVCNTCRRVAEGLHPDLVLLERDGQFIKIDAARELVRQSTLRPYEGRAHVFLLPEAERLHEESANTLLKTLEEPPPDTYLMLVTSSREGVLPTIRSRCQGVELHPLARADLAALLIARHGLEPAEADLRARFADGSEPAAMDLDLDGLRAARGELVALLEPLARGQMSPKEADAILRVAEDAAKGAEALDLVLFRALRSLARDALVRASGGGLDLVLNLDAVDAVDTLAAALGPAGASALLADLERAEDDLRVNANRKLLVEAVLAGVYTRVAKRRPPERPRAGPRRT